MTQQQIDERFMKEALRLAEQGRMMGEVPVGAVIVKDGEILCGAHNLRNTDRVSTAHAELLAMEQACRQFGDWRLTGCTLYVTLEPCPMCAGAIVNSRIERVVFGTKDPVAGCCGSVLNFNAYPFNHAFAIQSGVCEAECRTILADFFAERRKQKERTSLL